MNIYCENCGEKIEAVALYCECCGYQNKIIDNKTINKINKNSKGGNNRIPRMIKWYIDGWKGLFNKTGIKSKGIWIFVHVAIVLAILLIIPKMLPSNTNGKLKSDIKNKKNKSVSYEYNYLGGVAVRTVSMSDGRPCYTCKFDVNGNIIEYVTFDRDGAEDDTTKYEYDDNGNMIRKRRTYSLGQEHEHEYEYEYDPNGNVITIVEKDINSEEETRIKIEYESNNKKGAKYTHYYMNDKWLSCIYYDKYGNITEEQICELDEKGRRIRRIRKSQDGTIDVLGDYEYDNDKNIGKYIRYRGDCNAIYEYNSDWNQLSVTVYESDGSFQSSIIYEYDRSGELARGTCYREDGTIDYFYNYEKCGNGLEYTYYNNEGMVIDYGITLSGACD